MQAFQDFLNYAAIAPLITGLVLFVGYVGKRAIADLKPKTGIPVTAENEPQQPIEPILEAIDPCNVLDWQQEPMCQPDTSAPKGKARRKSTADAKFIDELLAIAPSPQPIEPPHDAALVPLAKLYAVPGAGKWAVSRKLRQSERERVLAAIAA